MLTVGTIVGGGFRLIRQHPLAVLVWAAIHAVMAFATQTLMMWQMRATGMLDSATSGTPPNPMAMMGYMVPSQILNFIVWCVTVILTCAAYRLVLRPREPGFAGLRVGMDEVRVFGTGFILVIAAVIVMVVLMLIVGLAALATGIFAQGSPGPAGIVVAVLGLAVFCAAIYVWVRLSVALPLTFARRRIGIDESWSLTRGHFWTLLAAYLVIGLIVVVIGLLVAFPYLATIFQAIAQAVQNPGGAEQVQSKMMEAMFDRPLPILIGLTALGGIAQALILALTAGATATAAHALLLDSGEVLEDDAENTAAIFE